VAPSGTIRGRSLSAKRTSDVVLPTCRRPGQAEDVAGRRDRPGPAATATFHETARLNSLGRQAVIGPIS
jgi:hypothetical protein